MKMDILKNIKEILTEILDIEDQEITPETYLIRDLGAESIDLLELAVAINSGFEIEVNDDQIFLKQLRLHMTDGEEQSEEIVKYLSGRFPFLTKRRVKEIIGDLEGGPVLKVKDLISYIAWISKNG